MAARPGPKEAAQKRILVTFWPAAPPRVSCFTVRCPDLKPDGYGEHTQRSATRRTASPLLHVTVYPEHQHLYSKKTSATSSNHRHVAEPKKDNTPPLVSLVHSLPDFPFFDREVAPAAAAATRTPSSSPCSRRDVVSGGGHGRGVEWTSLTNGILVTFWPAAPPRVSCFIVRCPDLKPDAYGNIPKRFATRRMALPLLRITVCPKHQHMYSKKTSTTSSNHRQVAAPKDNTPPLVRLVHSLPDFPFFDREVALLRRHDQDTFFIVVLPYRCSRRGRAQTWR
ncbi:hypothetical protein ZWY2020_044716 [Hordeum vulgare]|nr:hypothetical protein ZWY2020_044716 [Hordeum vulgare]